VSDPFEVVWSPAAQRDLRRLPEKVGTAVVEFVYSALATNPHRVGSELRLGLKGLHSARRGDYRVIYAIDDAQSRVSIVTVEHRSDVYRRRQR
jgi:mRNA interferase RelE/StbE